ncbi:MAG: CDP-archaeol synthase [Proteobacteria bacterium]|nr:CDP-archaeol synthase [Pseudomonadota bacterium]
MDRLKDNGVFVRTLSAFVLFSVIALVYIMGNAGFYGLSLLATLYCLFEILKIKRKSANDCLIQLFFVFYVILSMMCCFYLYLEYGRSILIWSIAIVTFNDTGAFFIGRHFKGKKLFPKISPNKTWSGFLGGLIVGTVLSFTLLPFLIDQTNINLSFFACILLSFSSHLGDLLESAFKRYFDIKDTGTLIPGHGGVLDRLDSLLMVNIVLYLFLLK